MLKYNKNLFKYEYNNKEKYYDISLNFARKWTTVPGGLPVSPRGYIDVGDGCWRPNVLVTCLRY